MHSYTSFRTNAKRQEHAKFEGQESQQRELMVLVHQLMDGNEVTFKSKCLKS